MRKVTLSPQAQAYLDEIWDYTEEQWGQAQAEAYTRSIKAACDRIAANPDLGRPCDHIRPGYLRHPVGSHVLFYRLVGADIEIVRILHRRMDFERHLLAPARFGAQIAARFVGRVLPGRHIRPHLALTQGSGRHKDLIQPKPADPATNRNIRYADRHSFAASGGLEARAGRKT